LSLRRFGVTAWQSASPEVFDAAFGLIMPEAEAQGCVRCGELNLQPLNGDHEFIMLRR
jgi:hypothetical protein